MGGQDIEVCPLGNVALHSQKRLHRDAALFRFTNDKADNRRPKSLSQKPGDRKPLSQLATYVATCSSSVRLSDGHPPCGRLCRRNPGRGEIHRPSRLR
jgi:hypothetical protein